MRQAMDRARYQQAVVTAARRARDAQELWQRDAANQALGGALQDLDAAEQQAAAEGLPDLATYLQHLRRVAEAAGALVAADDELRRRRLVQQLVGDDSELCELRESLISALRAALRGAG